MKQDSGYYYLHENGDLIWKKYIDDPNSPFIKRIWRIDYSDRSMAWIILIEGLALGAHPDRIKELARHWECDAKDLFEFMRRNSKPTLEQRTGLRLFLNEILDVNPREWLEWLGATPDGAEPDFTGMPVRRSAIDNTKFKWPTDSVN